MNRWIVPLEKRYDYLNLTSGRKIQVPFDQFIVFSTNLEPRDLVDEAFLRRIPYKIDVCDPTEQQFRSLFLELAAAMEIEPCRSAAGLPDPEVLSRHRAARCDFATRATCCGRSKSTTICLDQPARLSDRGPGRSGDGLLLGLVKTAQSSFPRQKL